MLIKGLPRIRRIRKLCIPGKIERKDFEKLQKGKEVEVLDEVASFLIKNDYAVLIKSKKPEKGVKEVG
jgi:hypothetical protein